MRRFSALVVLACVVAAVPAGAQEERASLLSAAGLPAALAAKIGAAMAQATSFRVRLTGGGTGRISTMVRAQKRTKVVDTDPITGVVSETVFADGRAYTRSNGGDWRLVDRPHRATDDPSPAKKFLDMTKITPLPDRVENGVTVGAYQMDLRLPVATQSAETLTFTCTYDKTTYLPRSCGNDVVTETFEGWNDPANVVDVPVVAAPNSL
jgi:hypothetical protein